jgi:hypothetical protein
MILLMTPIAILLYLPFLLSALGPLLDFVERPRLGFRSCRGALELGAPAPPG